MEQILVALVLIGVGLLGLFWAVRAYKRNDFPMGLAAGSGIAYATAAYNLGSQESNISLLVATVLLLMAIVAFLVGKKIRP